MEFLRGDAHLASQSKLSSIGKASRGIHIDGGGIHHSDKLLCRSGVLRQNRLAVPGRVGGNMGNGFVLAVHNANGQNIV